MLQAMTQYWWAVLLRGIAAILFGIAALVWPGPTLAVLVMLFGVYAVIDGIFAVVVGIQQHGTNERWWAILLEGIAGIGLGVLALFWPGMTALALVYTIAVWAIVTGVLEIATAIQLRKVIEGEWMMMLSGAASVLFGVVLFSRPGSGALALVWLIGLYAVAFGVLLSILAFQLRSLGQSADQMAAGTV